MADTTLNGITLHGDNTSIVDNTARKEAILAIMPLYLSDSDNTDVFDFGGTTKVITFSGVKIGDDVDALKTWVDSVEALIQGHQDTGAGYPLELVDDLRGTINVKILDFDSTYVDGSPTRVDWTLKLVQSSTNA